MAKPFAVIRNLSGIAQALTRMGQAASALVYREPDEVIPGIESNSFPNPSQPVRPIAPPGSEPLAFPYNYGMNLTYTPRSDAEYSAADLKRLSEYPLARWCIENVKDIVSGLKWQIQPRAKFGEPKQALQERAAGDRNIAALTHIFERPDGEHDWPEWSRPLLDDMLVADAPAVLLRRSKKGDIGELRVVPGHTIVRYIDVNGYTPKPPAPAYAQLWEGIPRVNLDITQLVYKPRNIAPRNTVQSYLYGFGPTEQAAKEIEVGWKRLEFTTLYYTAGAVPGLIHIVPPNITPEQIENAMKNLNSRLAGNLVERQQWQMLQGFLPDGKDQIIQTKDKLLADPFDDLHIRKICFAYGTSPQRLLKMMNRAASQSNQAAAQEEGTKPWANWLFNTVMNYILQVQMGYADYEFGFSTDTETDPVKIATADNLRIGKTASLNEIRRIRGEDPRPEPEANEIGMITTGGWVSITMHAPLNAPGGGAGGPGGEPGASPKPGEPKPAPVGGEPGEPGSNGQPAKPPKAAAMVVIELQKAVDGVFTMTLSRQLADAIYGLERIGVKKKSQQLRKIRY